MTAPRPAGDGEHICGRWCAQHTAMGGPLDVAEPAAPEPAPEMVERLRDQLVCAIARLPLDYWRGLNEVSRRAFRKQLGQHADELLSGPLAAVLAERDELRAKATRVEALADKLAHWSEINRQLMGSPEMPPEGRTYHDGLGEAQRLAADRIRRALDGAR